MMVRAAWKPHRLDELGFVGRGKSRHRPRGDARLYGGPYPLVQTADIMAADPYITSYSQTYSEFGLQQSKIWPRDTLCITIAGANTARTAILKLEACFPDSVVGFIPEASKADLHFVKHSLDEMRHRFLSVTRGATQDNLSLDKLLSFPILAPDIDVQRRIGSILAAYDDLLDNCQRRINILESLARALYRETLVPDAHAVTKGPLMTCPYWRFISESIDRFVGKRRYYATADINGLTVTGEGIDYEFAEKPSRAQKQPIPNSVWFARMKDSYKIAWYGSAKDGRVSGTMLSSGFAGFESRDPDLWPLLFLTISSQQFHQQKDLYCTGATQMSLTNEGLARIEMPLPAEESARRLGRNARPLLDAMLVLQRKGDVLRRTRDLLLPRLLSGQIDVGAA